MRECKRHGLQEFNLYGKCKICNVESVTRARQEKKKKLVEYFGGKCIECGYNKCYAALTFHHRDENKKSFSITDKKHFSLEKLTEEAKKCMLLCFNCHMEIHSDIDSKR